MDNILDSMGQQGTPMPMGGANQSPLGMVASPASMSPVAMNNTMGNPMANEGANVMPYLSMQQNFMPQDNKQGKTYARGGYVQMMEGGNPMDAMAAQGMMPPEAGGLEQAAMADPGMQAGAEEGMEEPEEETEHPLAELAASVDNQEGMQLTFINAEEHQALMQQTGEEIPPAEQISDNPEAIAQLMEGAEGDDYMLVYLSEEQFAFLAQSFGEPSINDASGLPQFFKKAFKKILKSPLVQAIAPIALNAFAPGIGSAIGGALGLGSMGTSALLGGGMGLLGGGGIKGALKGAAMGGLGQMGGEMLGGGSNPFSGIMGGGGGGTEGGGGLLDSLKSGAQNLGSGISNMLKGPTPESQFVDNGQGLMVPKSEQQKSGLASLMPSSTAGKLGLLGAGAALLGGGGSQQQSGQPVPPPQAPDATKLPNWQLNRQAQNVDPNSYFQSGGNRNFFNDQWSSAPQAAKRGGLIGFADGGSVDEYGSNLTRGVDTSGGEGPMSLADRANAKLAQARGLDTYRDAGPSPGMGRNPGPGRSYRGFREEFTPGEKGISSKAAVYGDPSLNSVGHRGAWSYMPENYLYGGTQDGVSDRYNYRFYDSQNNNITNRFFDTNNNFRQVNQDTLNNLYSQYRDGYIKRDNPNAQLDEKTFHQLMSRMSEPGVDPKTIMDQIHQASIDARFGAGEKAGDLFNALQEISPAVVGTPDKPAVKKRIEMPPPRSKLGWEADIPLYSDDKNELRFSGRGDTGRKNASGMINYTRKFAEGGDVNELMLPAMTTYANPKSRDLYGANLLGGADISGGEGPAPLSLAAQANAKLAGPSSFVREGRRPPSGGMGRGAPTGREGPAFREEITPGSSRWEENPGLTDAAWFRDAQYYPNPGGNSLVYTDPRTEQASMYQIHSRGKDITNQFAKYDENTGVSERILPKDLAGLGTLNVRTFNDPAYAQNIAAVNKSFESLSPEEQERLGYPVEEANKAFNASFVGTDIPDVEAGKQVNTPGTKKRIPMPQPRSKLGWEADIPLYSDDKNELRFSGRGDTGRKNAMGMINYTRRFADGGMAMDGEEMQMGRRGMGGRDMEQPDAPPIDYMDQIHRLLYSMPNQMGGPAQQAAQQGQQQGMPPQQGAPGGLGQAAMAGGMGGMGGMPQQPPMAGSSPMARGGLACGGYAGGGMYDDGGLLSGEGDGVSDDIDATIGGQQPAKLSGGEFVIPARVVSELGNGSTEAGADRLYEFMEKVQSGMRKNKDIAKNTKAYQHLPA